MASRINLTTGDPILTDMTFEDLASAVAQPANHRWIAIPATNPGTYVNVDHIVTIEHVDE